MLGSVYVFLPIPRKKKKVPQSFEWGQKWPQYGKLAPLTHIWGHGKNLHSRSSGGQAQRRGGKQTVPTSLQTAHMPDSSLQHLRALPRLWHRPQPGLLVYYLQHQVQLAALLLRETHITDFSLFVRRSWELWGYICLVHLEHWALWEWIWVLAHFSNLTLSNLIKTRKKTHLSNLLQYNL